MVESRKSLINPTTATDSRSTQKKKIALPKEFLELKKEWKKIRSSLSKLDDVGDSIEKLVGYYDARLAASCFAFDPIIESIDQSKIDRLGEVLRGPVYTCSGYEWPVEAGYPMVPLIQLDLGRCGKLGDVGLEDGLLQVFMGHGRISGNDATVRVIPRSEVNVGRLMPVPEFDSGIKSFAEIGWATRKYDPDDEASQALQIVGYAATRFTMHPMSPFGEMCDMDVEDLVSLDIYPDQVAAFNDLLASLKEKFDASGFHLFGTFYPIQYNATERPKVLFSLESERGFNFGYDGNGQIFFNMSKGGVPRFFLDWSCY